MNNPMPPLQFGDICLYAHKSIVNRVIEIKTWSKLTHVEVVLDPLKTNVASRNGIGVNIYPFDDTVFEIRRPKAILDKDAGMRWFYSVRGQPYNWWDLLSFIGINIKGHGMICSQFADEMLDACGFDAFSKRYSARKISPRDWDVTEACDDVWCRDPKWNT